MKRFLTLVLALTLFVNESALGKTVQLDQLNVMLDIPDNFVKQDVDNSVYSAVKKVGDTTETICITSVDGINDFTDDYVNTVTENYVKAGFRVISCEPKDRGDFKFLVSELHNQDLTEAKYDVCTNNRTISIIFTKSPAIESRLVNDPTVNDVIDSFVTGVIPDTTTTPTDSNNGVAKGVGFSLGGVVGVLLIARRIYRIGKALS